MVLKRASGPIARSAATAVSSFMFDAGILLAAPSRSKSTLPVAASWTTPVKVPPPSVLRTGSSLAATSAGTGTGAALLSGPMPWGTERRSGMSCHAGVWTARAADWSGPVRAGAISIPAGRASTASRSVSSAVGQARISAWSLSRLFAVPVVPLILLVLKVLKLPH